jgi:hypothetical protein
MKFRLLINSLAHPGLREHRGSEEKVKNSTVTRTVLVGASVMEVPWLVIR